MAELKTKKTRVSVANFINSVENDTRRNDAKTLLKLMKKVTRKQPKMWGASIVGFGQYHYKYDSGHEGDWAVTGFSPRKASMVVYIMSGFSGHDKLMKKLGKHKTGKSCLYINKLADVDLDVLETLVAKSVEYMNRKYG